MILLTIRTDNPEAEIGLFENESMLLYDTWQAHRVLAETLHARIATVLQQQGKVIHEIDGIIVFEGPGSFTGLRIGLTVANVLADNLKIPVVGAQGEDWTRDGIKRLLAGENQHPVLPFYGADVHITTQKK